MIDSAESEISRDDLEQYGFDLQALHPTDAHHLFLLRM